MGTVIAALVIRRTGWVAADPIVSIAVTLLTVSYTHLDVYKRQVQDLRNQIRDQLSEEKSMRRLLDSLRRETFVTVMLEEKVAAKP